jgi:hypothetical protein
VLTQLLSECGIQKLMQDTQSRYVYFCPITNCFKFILIVQLPSSKYVPILVFIIRSWLDISGFRARHMCSTRSRKE